MEEADYLKTTKGVKAVEIMSDTKAKITLDAKVFNGKDADIEACVLPLIVKSGEVGDVVVKFTSNVTAFKTASEVIANVQTCLLYTSEKILQRIILRIINHSSEKDI